MNLKWFCAWIKTLSMHIWMVSWCREKCRSWKQKKKMRCFTMKRPNTHFGVMRREEKHIYTHTHTMGIRLLNTCHLNYNFRTKWIIYRRWRRNVANFASRTNQRLKNQSTQNDKHMNHLCWPFLQHTMELTIIMTFRKMQITHR